MTSKEALEKISYRYVNDPSFQEWCDIIKQDLERLEELEDRLYKAQFLEEENSKIFGKYQELKKVIEILKDKLEIFIETTKYGYPFVKCWQQSNSLTQEEYDLVKEVLEDE